MKDKNTPKKRTVNVRISQEAHDKFINCQKIYMKIEGEKYNLHRLFEKVVTYAYDGLNKELKQK